MSMDSSPAEQAVLATSIPLSYRARECWRKEMSFEAYIVSLLEAELAVDAVRLLAAVLPPRELVWWSALCTYFQTGPTLPALEHSLLTATVHWIRDSNRANYARVVQLLRECPARSPVHGPAAAVYYFGYTDEASGPMNAIDLAMAVKCAQSNIFEALDNASTKKPEQLAAIGLMLLKTPRHWNPK